MNAIPLIRPSVRFEDVEADIREILESGLLTNGRHVRAFESEVAEACGVAHAVATTSATTALHLSLKALDVGPGDEVVVADFTFPATANAVISVGAQPVLVDSASDGFGIDPDALAAALTQRTAAIIPVDPFGQPADYEAIERIAADAGLPVVADAACSLGAHRAGRAAGAHGTMGCFSFHPRKMITCGEGGMITTNNEALADRLRRLRAHGATPDGVAMRFHEAGFNYRMTEIQAALGRSQLPRLAEIVKDRRSTASTYAKLLDAVHGITVPRPPPDTEWSYQSYVVLLADGLSRDDAIMAMREREIETTIGTYACHNHPAYSRFGLEPGDLPNSAWFEAQALTLPLVPEMSISDVERVVAELDEILGLQAGRR